MELTPSNSPSLLSGVMARLRRLDGLALRIGVGVIFAVVLLYTFSRLVNVGAVWMRLRHLDLWLAAFCGLVFLSAYVIRALRWRFFLHERGYPVGAMRAIMIYQVALFVNWLLPVRGGELVKSLLLRRLDGTPISESLSTVAMDKSLDLLPSVVLIALLPFMPFQLGRPLWTVLLFAFASLVCGGLFVALAAWRRPVALNLLHSVFARLPHALQRVEPFVVHFLDTLLELVVRPRLLAKAALLTVVAVAFDAWFCQLAFAAVGAPVSFPLVLFGYTLFNLAFILPTPPGQIGSNEVLGLLIFNGVFGVNGTSVGAMFLFSHPWTAILMAVSGLICLSAMGLSVRSAIALTRNKSQVRELEAVPVGD